MSTFKNSSRLRQSKINDFLNETLKEAKNIRNTRDLFNENLKDITMIKPRPQSQARFHSTKVLIG